MLGEISDLLKVMYVTSGNLPKGESLRGGISKQMSLRRRMSGS